MIKKISSFQIIIISFAMVILTGTLLLMFPFSSSSGNWTSFLDALFTATSATCVTGLVVVDTATYWSFFGQLIILLLIQIGGLGIITIMIYLVSLIGARLSIKQRTVMQSAISAPNISGIIPLTKFIFITTFIIEFIGAVLLLPVFVKDFGTRGIWLAIFHSISAFCNAGFDLMGNFSSLTAYSDNVIINIVIPLLIVVGGISFFTWHDFKKNKFRISRYSMQSKVILFTTLFLIFVPALYFFFFEFEDMSIKERIFSSIFQSVTTRTAGFNTVDLTSISEAGSFIMVLLMLIGAGPSSTGGGMKVTTFAVIIAILVSLITKRKNPHLFKRRIANNIIVNSISIFFLYVSLFSVGAVLISIVEQLPILTCLYETSSAVATVGLSLGITPALGSFSRIILIILMFFGRIGGLTIIFATLGNRQDDYSKFPQEDIIIG